VPSGSHAEEEAEAEGLPGDDGGGVGEEACFDELLALVELGGGKRSEKEEGRKQNSKGPSVIDRRYTSGEKATHFGGRR
jgi:hypothetical protein